MKNEYSRHHLVPRSAGGSNEKCNILGMGVNQHRALHTLFGNAHPIAQLRLIIEMSRPVLIPSVSEEVLHVLGRRDVADHYVRAAVNNKLKLLLNDNEF